MNTIRITESHGDEPITIRRLVEIAKGRGWSLDTPLAYADTETDEMMIARGVRCLETDNLPGVRLLDIDLCTRTSGASPSTSAWPTSIGAGPGLTSSGHSAGRALVSG